MLQRLIFEGVTKLLPLKRNKCICNTMKKGFVTGLIYFMALVIVGLVAMQYFFIRLSYEEKQEIYNQHIYQVLRNTTERLKSRQSVLYVYEKLNARVEDSIKPVDPTMLSLSYPSGSRLDIDIQMGDFGRQHILNARVLSDNSGASFDQIQMYFEEMIHENKSDLYEIMQKMESEINLRALPLSRIYTNNAIKTILSEELKAQGFSSAFEYAVSSNGNIHPNLKSKGFSKYDLNDSYSINLQPKSIFNFSEYLHLKLPDRKAFLLESMSMQITLSVIFVLIILITFFVSTYIIIRQKRLGEMKSDFISNMTHEFKTPIATIRLAADSLKNAKVLGDEKLRNQFTNIISQETLRLNGQVEKVLEIASLEKGEIKLNKQKTDIHELICEVVKTMELPLNEKNGTLSLDLKATEYIYLVDKEHMMNVISNLIDNAIKYSDEAPQIEIETLNRHEWIYISVIDHGIGMDNVTLTRIFEKFYRAGGVNIHNVKGFGLGLHYVKEIISAHKGLIDVSSSKGKGSTFTIKLLKK
jgi:two-component system, OmpR family, phosphate regulon sensor histidine kinase PhoR